LTVWPAGAILNRVVEGHGDALSAVFRALGDPTRREMLRRLATADRTVGELAEPFDMSLAAASKHVRVLERAGLVRRKVEGRTHRCRLDAARLAGAQRWLAFYQRFWTQRLDALDALLAPRAAGGRQAGPPAAPPLRASASLAVAQRRQEGGPHDRSGAVAPRGPGIRGGRPPGPDRSAATRRR
jgi:DNA-binding transcriptional ArsR family regulator